MNLTPETLTLELTRRAIGWNARYSAPLQVGRHFPWPQWLSLVARESLSPLLGYYFLTDPATEEFIEPSARKSCTNRFYATLAANGRTLQKAASVVDSLARAGIPAIVLKGAYLAESVYASSGCRAMGDVDVLIRPGDYSRSARLLRDLGYTTPADIDLGIRQETSPSLNAVMWRCAEAGWPPVHLHWHLFNSGQPLGLACHLDEAGVWQQARTFQFCGVEALALAPRHLILHLGEHALRHGYDRLVLLADLAAATLRFGPALDWPALREEAKISFLLSSLQVAMILLDRYLEVSLPAAAGCQDGGADLSAPERRLLARFPGGRGSRVRVHHIYAARCYRRGTGLRFLKLSLWPDRRRLALQSAGAATRLRYFAEAIKSAASSLR
jgi:hypothetical protein